MLLVAQSQGQSLGRWALDMKIIDQGQTGDIIDGDIEILQYPAQKKLCFLFACRESLFDVEY